MATCTQCGLRKPACTFKPGQPGCLPSLRNDCYTAERSQPTPSPSPTVSSPPLSCPVPPITAPPAQSHQAFSQTGRKSRGLCEVPAERNMEGDGLDAPLMRTRDFLGRAAPPAEAKAPCLPVAALSEERAAEAAVGRHGTPPPAEAVTLSPLVAALEAEGPAETSIRGGDSTPATETGVPCLPVAPLSADPAAEAALGGRVATPPAQAPSQAAARFQAESTDNQRPDATLPAKAAKAPRPSGAEKVRHYAATGAPGTTPLTETVTPCTPVAALPAESAAETAIGGLDGTCLAEAVTPSLAMATLPAERANRYALGDSRKLALQRADLLMEE
eukprot:jgi/Tetstr1/420822/TSEL_011898.t1